MTHIDEGSLDYLIQKFRATSFLDIGCGPGGMVTLAKERGLDALGIDGDPNILDTFNLIRHDFTEGPIILPETYDIGYSVEFLEHVEEEYLENIFSAFKKCRVVLITHALPGNVEGHHHVNLQTEEYWIHAFENNGFIYDEPSTLEIRIASTMRKQFVGKTGKVFRKK